METILLYDSSRKIGHQVDYLRYLINYITSLPTGHSQRFLFVLSSVLLDRLQPANNDHSLFIPIPETILSRLKDPIDFSTKYQNSMIEGTYIQEIIQQYNAQKVIFMILDTHIMLAGRSAFYPPGVKVSGIYFRPLPSVADDKKGWLADKLAFLKKGIKACLLKAIISFSPIEKVYVSEDTAVVDWLNRHVSDGRFAYLPDPVDQQDIPTDDSWRTTYSIGPDVPVYLIFGVIGERKNVTNSLTAYGLGLTRQTIGVSRLLIVGKFESEEYKQTVTGLVNQDPLLSTHVIIHNEFVSNFDREQLFGGCLAVVMPYIHCQGASGVLGHAARYGKPVIAPNKGIVAQLVHRYDLGFTVDPTDIDQLDSALSKAASFTGNESLKTTFLTERLPAKFASMLLG